MFDDNQLDVIAQIYDQKIYWQDPNGYALQGQLPYTLIIAPSADMNQPTRFEYATDHWASDDTNRCTQSQWQMYVICKPFQDHNG